MRLTSGTAITWSSAAGDCRGVIREIYLAPAAGGKTTPWILVDRWLSWDGKKTAAVELCATDDYLKTMQVAPAQI